jgi:hypothetical protein
MRVAAAIGLGLFVVGAALAWATNLVLEDVPLAVEFRGGGPGVTVRR